MQAKADAQLLREYSRQSSEAAFGELVARYTNLIYSAVLRQVGSADIAEEVAQSVFTDLARKATSLAGNLDENGTIVGWLYRSSRYAVSKHLRAEQRRHNRESQAMQDFDSTSATSPDWERVRPVLDEALADLGEEDRQAMLLRFFQNQGFQAVGAALGISDDAAQKRVVRALEKFRARLARHGITTTATMLSAVLSTNAIQTAPAGLATKLAGVSLAGATASTATTLTTLTIMTTSFKIGIVATGIAAALAVWLLVEHRSSARPPQQYAQARKPQMLASGKAGDREAATIEALRLVGTACRIYASAHNSMYPTNIGQIPNEYVGALSELGLGPDSFEFFDYGNQRLTDSYPESLLAREKKPRQLPDGKWMRAYLMGDGSVQEATSGNGDFKIWEQQPRHQALQPFRPPVSQ